MSLSKEQEKFLEYYRQTKDIIESCKKLGKVNEWSYRQSSVHPEFAQEVWKIKDEIRTANETKDDLLQFYKAGMTIMEACKRVGKTRKWFRIAKENDKEFATRYLIIAKGKHKDFSNIPVSYSSRREGKIRKARSSNKSNELCHRCGLNPIPTSSETLCSKCIVNDCRSVLSDKEPKKNDRKAVRNWISD